MQIIRAIAGLTPARLCSYQTQLQSDATAIFAALALPLQKEKTPPLQAFRLTPLLHYLKYSNKFARLH